MFGRKNKDAVYLAYDEKSILLRALVELKNSLIREGKYTDAVDEPVSYTHLDVYKRQGLRNSTAYIMSCTVLFHRWKESGRKISI